MQFSGRRAHVLKSLIVTRFKAGGLQSRFIRQWLMGWLVLNFFLFIPLFYLVQQNYKIFLHLAHLQAPYLIEHLERENAWSYGLLLSSLLASFLWGLGLALRWSGRVFSPLLRIQDHLYHLSRGRWNIPPLTFDDPEIQTVANSYNYFYKSLQMMTRQQLELINLIKVNPTDFDSKEALHRIQDETSSRLDSASGASTTTSRDQQPTKVFPLITSDESKPTRAGRHAS